MTKKAQRNRRKYSFLLTAIEIAALFVFVAPVFAAPRYVPSEAITLGDFLYNDDYTPSTGNCYINIWNPSGTLVVNNVLMTADANGWHHYTFAGSTTEGMWPATMTCGTSGVDLISEDKTFEILSSEASATADAVWNEPSRTLTSGTNIADDIWGATSRTLTSFGTLVSDVWSNTTRSLTTKSLGASGNLATETYLDTMKADIIAEVNENQTLISALNNISSADVWAYGTRGLTQSVDLSTDAKQGIWDVAKTNLTTSGSVGKLVADNLDAQVSSRSTLTAADVWSNATRTLSDYATDSTALAVWSAGTRTLTSYGNNITAADVWNVLSSNLTLQNSIGKQLAENVDVATSTRASQASLDALNNISATDVWSYSNRSITDPDAIWEYALTDIGNSGSIGKLLKDNINATISSRSNITAADVWSVTERTLTSNANFNDPTSAAIASAVWANATRDLTNYGNDITAADVWNVLSSNLTTNGTIGKQLAVNVDATVSSRSTLTAADVWNNSTRSLTTFGSLVSDIWGYSSRSLTTFGTLVADIWEYGGGRTLSSFGTLVADVWSNTTRSLTNYGNDIAAADVWNYLSQVNGSWKISMSNAQQILAGNQYRVKVYTSNNGQSANSYTAPLVTIYDVNRNVVVNSVAMSNIGTGIYEYVYTVAAGAPQGIWETITNTETVSGNVITVSDYWEVRGSPAQVIIRGMSDTTIPQVAADVTITNEGSGGYEYLYEWCVVNNINNVCGGGDDVFYASGAKFIQPGENWNTNLAADVATAGPYYFKLVVYFGTESSGSSRSFTATTGQPNLFCGDNICNNNETCSTCPGDCGQCVIPGGGGGGGGGGSAGIINIPSPFTKLPKGANIKGSGKVNSVDFSMLLYYWKTKPPFKNPNVDINHDGKVDAIDFSIMLYQWGTAGTDVIKKK